MVLLVVMLMVLPWSMVLLLQVKGFIALHVCTLDFDLSTAKFLLPILSNPDFLCPQSFAQSNGDTARPPPSREKPYLILNMPYSDVLVRVHRLHTKLQGESGK